MVTKDARAVPFQSKTMEDVRQGMRETTTTTTTTTKTTTTTTTTTTSIVTTTATTSSTSTIETTRSLQDTRWGHSSCAWSALHGGIEAASQHCGYVEKKPEGKSNLVRMTRRSNNNNTASDNLPAHPSLHFFFVQSQINTCHILLLQPVLFPLACTFPIRFQGTLLVNFGFYSLHFLWFWFNQPAFFYIGTYGLHFSWFWLNQPALFDFGSYALHFSWFWFNQPALFYFGWYSPHFSWFWAQNLAQSTCTLYLENRYS